VGFDVEIGAASGAAAKARALFKGMFERSESNVQKGRFAQALAARIEDDKLDVVVPEYIISAVKHVSAK
jgi:putative ATP-dependent endonuclease of OLD family